MKSLTANERAVLAALTRAADVGGACPSNNALCDAAGILSPGLASELVGRLEAMGLIRVERLNAARRVTIVSTGHATEPVNGAKHWRARDDWPSGAVLAERIEAAAAVKGQGVNEFAAPLSRDPASWLEGLRKAARPKRHTIERIEALIAGRPVPPLPAEAHRVTRTAQLSAGKPDLRPPEDAVRVYRDPCPRCGVRADIGCRHTARALTGAVFG